MPNITYFDQEGEEAIRAIAREEVASLAGLVLRRLQDDRLTRSPQRNQVEDQIDETLSAIFGEALRDFGASSSEPGA